MVIFKGVGIAAAALTITALTAGPSIAQGYSHTDPTGDMVRYSDAFNLQTGKETRTGPTPAPGQTNGDITSLTAHHRARRVSATVHLADLRSNGGSGPAATFGEVDIWMKTGAGRVRRIEMVLDGNRRHWIMLRGSDGRSVRCRFTHSYDATTHTVRVSVPRSCLGRPKVVRVGAMGDSEVFTGTRNTQADDSYRDDALRNGAANAYGWPALSPWLKRG